MAQYTPSYQPGGEEVAIIKTSKGAIKVALAGKDAPIHVANFVELANKGFYEDLKFHRYVPGFVIQGGCPNTRKFTPEEVIEKAKNPCAGLGTGNPGYTIKEEYSTNPNNKHLDGALAMARSQDPNSAGSQFYLCLGSQSMLDDGYTVFGQTTEGFDVIRSLRVGDVIEGIEIENVND
ncbi:MAG: peptidylprolyl isomerase [Eggerthellaceae bacterium]|jgi:peptidyl-prolyl cis-trans isomerase B (cyclophilin B)|nr:peptidylprolyl isomerase [Eggerthellaceae bacterium]MDR2721987.1 peptidylprolyl isomerase [Coriobacteriaceae bacterium]